MGAARTEERRRGSRRVVMVVKCISSSAEADLNWSVGFCSVSGICGCVRVCVFVCGFL